MPTIHEQAEALRADLVGFRRELHRAPEIGLDLPRTQQAILSRLAGIEGLEITLGERLSSVTVVLRGERPSPGREPGPVILLRGDMDALPIDEATELDYTSETPGAMHACGHDLHVAALYGALRLLSANRMELCGDVVFMFQPGEEVYNGARFMIEDGVLDAAGRRVDVAFGLHVYSAGFENGIFYSRAETLMAGCDELFVTVRGAGGHGASPHLAQDPIPVACEMVLAMQTLITRGFDAFDPVIATVGRIEAGTQGNIIPDIATFDLTLRIFSPEHREKLVADMRRLCTGIAAAHGLEVEITQAPDYPVTVNAPTEHLYAAEVAHSAFGQDSFREMEFPVTGSEDFSHVLREVPGAYFFLGATVEGNTLTPPHNHSPRATFDDSVLPQAAEFLAELALQRADSTRNRSRRGTSRGESAAQ